MLPDLSQQVCVCVFCSTACCCMTFFYVRIHFWYTISTLHPNLRQNVKMNWNDENTFDFVIMIVEFRELDYVCHPLRVPSAFFVVVVRSCLKRYAWTLDMHQLFHSNLLMVVSSHTLTSLCLSVSCLCMLF